MVNSCHSDLTNPQVDVGENGYRENTGTVGKQLTVGKAPVLRGTDRKKKNMSMQFINFNVTSYSIANCLPLVGTCTGNHILDGRL